MHATRHDKIIRYCLIRCIYGRFEAGREVSPISQFILGQYELFRSPASIPRLKCVKQDVVSAGSSPRWAYMFRERGRLQDRAGAVGGMTLHHCSPPAAFNSSINALSEPLGHAGFDSAPTFGCGAGPSSPGGGVVCAPPAAASCFTEETS
jgi:hypothetical protein